MQNRSDIEVTNIPKVGNIVITNKLKNKIDYLHRQVGKLEWSGILIYNLKSGNISNMKDLVFEAVNVYPMDIGSQVSTGFEYTTEDLVNMYDSIEDAIEMSTGLIHSHHNMQSFISDTDFNEIKNNAGGHNFYISLVVSFDQSYVCKIAFPSVTVVTKTSTVRNEMGQSVVVSSTQEEESLLLGDLSIVFEEEEELEQWFTDKVVNIKKAKTAAVKSNVGFNRDYSTGVSIKPTTIDSDYENKHWWTRQDQYAKVWENTMGKSEKVETFNSPSKVITPTNKKENVVIVPPYIYMLAATLGVGLEEIEDVFEYFGEKEALEDFGKQVADTLLSFQKVDWDDLRDCMEANVYDGMIEVYGDTLDAGDLDSTFTEIMNFVEKYCRKSDSNKFKAIIKEYLRDEVKK